MPHFHERNIVEIKNIYTTFLVNIISPLIYEGLKSLYENSNRADQKVKNAIKTDPNVVDLGILKIFQLCLKKIPEWNTHLIDTETKRIKEQCKCSEWFDDLLKAVVKSNIILLTYSADAKSCDIVNNKLHETVDTNFFIHSCYIECAKMFFNYPEIFYHGYSTLDIKRNQREAIELIKKAIEEAIKNMLPIKMILQEYLSNDYIRDDNNNVEENMSESRFVNLKSMIDRDLNDDKINNFDDGVGGSDNNNNMFETKSLLVENSKHMTSDAYLNQENNEISNQLDEVEKIINDEKINENEEMNQKINNPVYVSSPKPIKTKKKDYKYNNVKVELVPYGEENKIKEDDEKYDDSENNFDVNVIDKINNDDDKFFNKLLAV
jgi:hypothetical protein